MGAPGFGNLQIDLSTRKGYLPARRAATLVGPFRAKIFFGSPPKAAPSATAHLEKYHQPERLHPPFGFPFSLLFSSAQLLL